MMELPPNSERKIYIPSNNEGLGFKYNCYSTEYLGSMISKEDFTLILVGANKICEKVWR